MSNQPPAPNTSEPSNRDDGPQGSVAFFLLILAVFFGPILAGVIYYVITALPTFGSAL